MSMGETRQISFADPAVQLCPFPAYDRLRQEEPVYHDPVTGHYVLTRYADIRKALLNVAVLSNRTGILGDRWCPEANQIFAENGWLPMDTLVSNDPPDHRFYRGLVDKVFAAGKVERLEPRIEAIINQAIDQIGVGEEFDFMAHFAVPLPMYVIAEQLGVEGNLKDKFKIWSEAAVDSVSPVVTQERQIELAHILVEMQQYIHRQVERLRLEPDDTLLSRLANLDYDGRKLTDQEIQSLALQLLVAGNETTTATLGSGMSYLIKQPELAEKIHSDPDLARAFVEETLRAMTPLQTLFRRALRDVEIDGVTIPAGSLVEVRFGAANRDPREFDCPANFELERKNASTHLAFGAGIHVCVGNQLARAELRLAFQALTRRLKNFRLTRGEESIRWVEGYTPHGFRELWMVCDRR